MDVFISHSSRIRRAAGRLEKMLEAEGLEVWLDDSEIRLGCFSPGSFRARSGQAIYPAAEHDLALVKHVEPDHAPE